MKQLLITVAIALLFVPATVGAQELTPSDGIPVPDGSIVTQSDSASLEVNPAGLGYLRGYEGAYGFFVPSSDYALTVPSGHSLSLGAGGSMGGIGVGLQWVDDRRVRPERFLNYQKFTLGGAFSPVRYISAGMNLNYFSSRSDERLNELMTVDAGIQVRPAEFLGLGLMARDAGPAFLDEDRALPLRIGVGMALRFLEGRLVVDNEMHYVQDADRFSYRPRLSMEPLSGLRIFGHGIVGVPTPGETGGPSFDGASIGLELSTGSQGLQGSAYLGQLGTSESGELTGIAGRAWAGSTQKRSLFSPRKHWVELKVDDDLDELAVSELFSSPTRSFLNLINNIDAIAEDDSVSGVVLHIGAVNLGYAQIWELHEAMDRLREVGKESVAIVDTEMPTTRTVYAASAADEIWMAPAL